MATKIVNCAEDYSKRRVRLSASLDRKDWSCTRAWTIFTQDPNFQIDGAQVVPIPGNDPLALLNDTHPQYAFMFAESAELAATDNPTFFTYTVGYKYTSYDWSVILDPLLRPPRWRFQIGEETVPIFFDTDGNPIVNSAGDFFDPQPQDVRATLSIRIWRNESIYDANKALNYFNSTNSDVWTLPNGQTLQPGQARMHCIEQGEEVDKNSRYVPVIYSVFLTDTDFNLQAVDQGYQAWDLPPGATDPVLEKIYIGTTPNNGTLSTTTVGSPVLLNGNGAPLNYKRYQLGLQGGSVEPNPYPYPWIKRIKSTPGVVGLKFKQLKLRSFNALNLV